MSPVTLLQRRETACLACASRCAERLALKFPVGFACPQGRWPVRSSADDHEIEAAQAGHVASCCGRPDTAARG